MYYSTFRKRNALHYVETVRGLSYIDTLQAMPRDKKVSAGKLFSTLLCKGRPSNPYQIYHCGSFYLCLDEEYCSKTPKSLKLIVTGTHHRDIESLTEIREYIKESIKESLAS